MHAFSVVCVLILLQTRPTSEEVTAAVAKSREQWVQVTVDNQLKGALSEITRERTKLEAELSRQKFRNEAVKRLYMKTHDAKVKALDKKEAEIRATIDPTKIPPRLMPIDWGRLPLGAVGHVGQEARNGVVGGEVRVIQILSADTFLGEYEYIATTYRLNAGGLPVPEGKKATKGVVLFAKIQTADLLEDKVLGQEFNAVVTGRYTYTSAEGAARTVPVLEAFDPDKPF